MDLKRIDELAAGVEWYLKQLSNFTLELKGVREDLRKVKESLERNQTHEIQRMQQQIVALTDVLRQQGVVAPSQYELELEQIKGFMKGEWPQAVPQDRICDTDEKKRERARGVINLFVSEYLKDKSFLDFGCKDDYCILAAEENEAASVLGYDIKLNTSSPHVNLTDDWKQVEDRAPYDVVLLHDVLDHIEMYDPIEALRKIKSVMSPDGRIYVRNHPWSSRHGGHLYIQKNLAFLHLILDEVELARVSGLQSEYNIKVLTPLETYRHWFKEAGLKIDSEMPIRTSVEAFFKDSVSIYGRLIKQWPQGQDPYNHMEIDFVEYVLSMDALDHQII